MESFIEWFGMGLQFIVGPAGSGKTRYILESIISRLQQNPPFSGKNLILLVPDQSTYQMERAILAGGSIEAFTNLHILSFSRLCHAVLDEVQGVGLPFITSIGKDMTLQSIIWKYRNEFQAFGAMAAHPGFRSALAKSISELKDFRVNPAVLRAVANPEHVPFLQAKAADLQIIYDDYLEFLRGFVDPDDF